MTTTVSISKDLDLYFLGRNGSAHMCGATIFPYGHVLDIRPITSIEALHAAVRELHPSNLERILDTTEGLGSPTIDQLTACFGAWGEHPDHSRTDWQHLVANRDTQRGYWEHVFARLKQERQSSADTSRL